MRDREKKEKECLNCGKAIVNMNVYCNNTCQNEYQTQLKLNEWLNGNNVVRKGGNSIPTWIKNYLLSQSNHKCSECGWGETNPHSGNIPLEIDHIDGDAYNNNITNLKVLCPNCHSLTKTYKNIGNRKSSRRYRNLLP
jgi:ribosomal protein S27AE